MPCVKTKDTIVKRLSYSIKLNGVFLYNDGIFSLLKIKYIVYKLLELMNIT